MADMTGTSSGLDARVAELESRIREMERRERETGPMRSILRELFPPEVRQHMRNARKEQLLAVRAMLDRWIEHAEGKESARTRERITLD